MEEEKKDLIYDREEKENGEKDKGHGMPLGLCIGLCFGVMIGAATHNLGLWMPIGLCIGAGLGAANKKDGQ